MFLFKLFEAFTYTEDTALAVFIKDSTIAKLNAKITLECLSDWLHENLLTLNKSKSMGQSRFHST